MVRRGPKRSVLCAQSEELHQKRACLESDARYGVGKFERGGGGVRIFGRGVREKGGSDEPPECECKATIVTGDFNCDASGDDSSTSNPVISNSNIDLIFTSHPEHVSESGVIHVLISDHYLVYGVPCWKAPKEEGCSIKFRCF